MRKKTAAVLMAALLLLVAVTSAYASPALQIPYTKKTALAYPATYTIRFSLCSSPTPGADDCIWSEEKDIGLTNAKIMTSLGDTNQTLSTVDFSQQYYVQVDRKKGNGTYKTLDSRDMLGVVPYALWSATSDSVAPGGTVTNVTAGSGLTGGGFGDVTLNVGSGPGIIVNPDTISVDTTAIQSRVTGTCPGGAISVINANGTVTCQTVGAGTVTSVGSGTGLTGGPITTTGTLSIATGGVTSAMIADGTIANADLAANSVNSGNIQDGTIATADLADGSITSAKILDSTISNADLGADSVTSAKIQDGTIVNADIANSTINSTKVDTTSIQARVTGTCGAGQFMTGVNAGGTVTCAADTNSGGTVTSVGSGAGLTGGPITGSGSLSIATGGVTSAMILDGTIAAADLADNSVTSAKIQDGTIALADIGSNGCTTGQVMQWTGAAWTCQTVGSSGTKTGYYNVAALQFSGNGSPNYLANSGYRPASTGSIGAALILPEGAQITELAATLFDKDTSYHVTVNLNRSDYDGVLQVPLKTVIASVETGDLEAGTDDPTSVFAKTITINPAHTYSTTTPTVSNIIPFYWLEVIASGDSSNLAFYNVRVTYTYTP